MNSVKLVLLLFVFFQLNCSFDSTSPTGKRSSEIQQYTATMTLQPGDFIMAAEAAVASIMAGVSLPVAAAVIVPLGGTIVLLEVTRPWIVPQEIVIAKFSQRDGICRSEYGSYFQSASICASTIISGSSTVTSAVNPVSYSSSDNATVSYISAASDRTYAKILKCTPLGDYNCECTLYNFTGFDPARMMEEILWHYLFHTQCDKGSKFTWDGGATKYLCSCSR